MDSGERVYTYIDFQNLRKGTMVKVALCRLLGICQEDVSTQTLASFDICDGVEIPGSAWFSRNAVVVALVDLIQLLPVHGPEEFSAVFRVLCPFDFYSHGFDECLDLFEHENI